ncbi:hypothetical protein WN944_011604 [Citrus x changshan-huyou]|uniref:Uncharacterized protein n=1 Tax=Citrus x changshan-huyou TaxID=2935761 RepID=A0AAP0N054_9ROSI
MREGTPDTLANHSFTDSDINNSVEESDSISPPDICREEDEKGFGGICKSSILPSKISKTFCHRGAISALVIAQGRTLRPWGRN